jgi:hypothetical protein
MPIPIAGRANRASPQFAEMRRGLSGRALEQGERPANAVEIVCQACHRINDHFPAGIVQLSGARSFRFEKGGDGSVSSPSLMSAGHHALLALDQIDERSSVVAVTMVAHGSPKGRARPGWRRGTAGAALKSKNADERDQEKSHFLGFLIEPAAADAIRAGRRPDILYCPPRR